MSYFAFRYFVRSLVVTILETVVIPHVVYHVVETVEFFFQLLNLVF